MAITHIMDKKGFMFTLVTIFLISIFVFILYSRSSTVMMEQQKGTAERTEAVVMNLFTKTLSEEYLDSIVKVASANALRAMLVYVNETGTEIPLPEDFFREIVVNGTKEGTYTVIGGTNYIAMQVEILNGTQEITYQSPSASGQSTAFGNIDSVVQKIHIDDTLEDIQYVTVNITNQTATSGDIYLVLYNDSSDGAVLMLKHQVVSIPEGTAQEVTFSIDGINPLNADTSYYVMLSAPFTKEEDDYYVDVSTTSNSLVEEDYQLWKIGGAGNNNKVLFDFYLSYAVIGEGFLRQLMNSFETLGKEKLNVDTTINLTSITVDGSPWEIEVNGTFLISTEKTTVSFSDIYSEGIGSVSIIGMYDPLSMLNYNPEGILTEDRQYLRITAQNVSDDFSEADMYRHLSEKTFVFNENAPSYLQRFAGENAHDFSSSCCGIQAVYLDSDILIEPAERGYSYVDYMFKESTQCNADGITDPLYAISVSSMDSEYQTLFNELGVSSNAPLFDFASIEFYHMEDYYTSGNCPTESAEP